MDMAARTVASQRNPTPRDGGFMAYRGPGPLRLTLIVSTAHRPEGPLEQLVGVSGIVRGKRKARPANKRKRAPENPKP